jgi:hypothetical protein
MAGKFGLKVANTLYFYGSFTCHKICDMGQDGFYFSSEGRRAEDFFALKIPTP